jgi:hypothetical protein
VKPGDVIADRFEIERLASSGGMGAVVRDRQATFAAGAGQLRTSAREKRRRSVVRELRRERAGECEASGLARMSCVSR